MLGVKGTKQLRCEVTPAKVLSSEIVDLASAPSSIFKESCKESYMEKKSVSVDDRFKILALALETHTYGKGGDNVNPDEVVKTYEKYMTALVEDH